MKKNVLTVTLLAVCMMFASCGKGNDAREGDTVQVIEGSEQPETGEGTPETGEQPEAGGDASEVGEKPETGGGAPADGKSSAENEAVMKELAAGETETETEEPVFLSERILKAGETMEILYPVGDNTMEQGLEITLQDAKLTGSPEEAQLDRELMEDSTEIYNLAGEPLFCSIEEARIMTCSLTVKNVNVESGDNLHISEIMIAYADPATGKVSIVSCMPAYFSASSSKVGASDYYHYSIPKGESREMTVAWLIPEEYEAEDLYLGVQYDGREPEERQYFRLSTQS